MGILYLLIPIKYVRVYTIIVVDFHSRHSLSAGGPGASSAPMRLRGLPWTRFSKQESRTLRSNQLCFKIQMELLLLTNWEI